MIRIARAAEPPAILSGRGREATERLCAEYDSAPGSYQDGTAQFEFEGDIYGAPSVREALRNAQYEKCAFCESKFSHTGYGAVEHFRPKGGFQQEEGEALGRPGYYWLAYEWSNLLLACQLCNQSYKRNLFPLRHPSTRARSHHDSVDNERPLLVNPSLENPGQFIAFRQEYAYPVRGAHRGKATIDVFGLNREALAESRRDQLRTLRLLMEYRQEAANRMKQDPSPVLAKKVNEIDTLLRSMFQDTAEYAAMNRAFRRVAGTATL